jgi:hypothetical protein
MKKIRLLILALLIPISLQAATPAEAAQAAAEPWLKKIDAAQYLETYQGLCSSTRGTLDAPRWELAIAQVRVPVGALVKRKLISAKYMTRLPDGPTGQYVMLQYQVSFAKNPSAVETVTMVLDRDNQWRAGGYYLK